MATWNSPAASPVERAKAQHAELTGAQPLRTASAPGTWVLIGENVDHFGGVTIMGLSDLRVAAAASPREDERIVVHTLGPYVDEFHGETSLAELADGTVDDPLLRRFAGLVQTMINRQVLSRDTTGWTITIVGDVPVGAGLGALYAADAAIALALAGGSDEVNEPPMRARLSEICSHSMATYSSLALLRARHTVALRGAEHQVSVVDYADGSLTAAANPAKMGVRIFTVAAELGQPHAAQKERIAMRRDFIDEAVANFGVSSLRELPDAVDRVVEWVEARADAGDETAPDPAVARQWVHFCETETLRSLATAKALRSRRGNELLTLLNSRSEAHDIVTPDALVRLALERGAAAARPAAAGTSQAVIAFVPVRKADEFAAAFEQGYEVVEIHPGAPARLED